MLTRGGLVWKEQLVVYYNSTMHWRGSYCLSEDDSSPRFQRLRAVFSTPMTEVYLLFYQLALQTFVHFNMFLQREDPLLPVLCQQMDYFLSKLASKFLPPSTIKAANRDFSTLNYMVRENQHPHDSLFVGTVTKTCGKCLKMVTSAKHRWQNSTMVLEHSMSFRSRESANFSQVEYFVERFNTLLPHGSPQDMDHLCKNLHSTSTGRQWHSSGCVGKGHCCRKRGQHIPNGYSVAPHINHEGSRQHTPLCSTLPDCEVDISYPTFKKMYSGQVRTQKELCPVY